MHYRIHELTDDLVDDYAHAHIEFLNTTYAHLVGADYGRARRAEFADRVTELRDDLAEARSAIAQGREPHRRHWVALSPWGAVIGVACSGEGIGSWEEGAVGEAWRPPSVTFTLDHLYLAPGVQGIGLGRRLLETAVPPGRGAYLWVIRDNSRAVAFYARHGFLPDGLDAVAGESWGRLPMRRLLRPAAQGSDPGAEEVQDRTEERPSVERG